MTEGLQKTGGKLPPLQARFVPLHYCRARRPQRATLGYGLPRLGGYGIRPYGHFNDYGIILLHQPEFVEAAILSSRIRIQVLLYKRRQQAAALRWIRKGSTGANVEALQMLLNGKGYNCGAVYCDFGSKTDTAVKKYQGAKGPTQDSVVGKQTWGKLMG